MTDGSPIARGVLGTLADLSIGAEDADHRLRRRCPGEEMAS
jgi:hypothetical protein